MSFATLIEHIISFLRLLVPVIIGVSVLYFIYGSAIFISNSNDSKARDKGRSAMKWGIIVIFVMVSLSGLAYFVIESAGLKNDINSPVNYTDFPV